MSAIRDALTVIPANHLPAQSISRRNKKMPNEPNWHEVSSWTRSGAGSTFAKKFFYERTQILDANCAQVLMSKGLINIYQSAINRKPNPIEAKKQTVGAFNLAVGGIVR